jgi:hypothetical protein
VQRRVAPACVDACSHNERVVAFLIRLGFVLPALLLGESLRW